MYFTENSFDRNRNEIIFVSDRASGEDRAPHESPQYSPYRMNLDTGIIERLSGDVLQGPHTFTKTPDSALLAYTTGAHDVRVLDLAGGGAITVYEEVPAYAISSVPSIAPNRQYVAFCRNEKPPTYVENGANYAGFKERYYRIKDGRVTLAYLDGSGWFDVFKDTHQLGHFQFSPDDSTLGMFCHEGPWNLVTQRIWFLDFVRREARPASIG